MAKQHRPKTDPCKPEVDKLAADIASKQRMPAAHRSGKSGRFKVPAHPDGATPRPAEEGGIGDTDDGA